MTTLDMRLIRGGFMQAKSLQCGPDYEADDGRKKKKKKSRHEKDPMRSHLAAMGEQLGREFWRTKVTCKTVGIEAIFADKEYCIDAAIALSKFGPGSITQLADENYSNPDRLQRELAARAVDVLHKAWEQCHAGGSAASLQFKKINKSAWKLAKENLTNTAIDTNTIGAVRSTSNLLNPVRVDAVAVPAFSHPHLCPPINPPVPHLESRPVKDDVPDLAPETPSLTGHKKRSKSPDFSIEDDDFEDDEFVDPNYEDRDYEGRVFEEQDERGHRARARRVREREEEDRASDFPNLRRESQTANDRAYEEAMRNLPMSSPAAAKEPTRSFPKLEPLTPHLNAKKPIKNVASDLLLAPLTPILSKEALAAKLGIQLNLEPIARPTPVKAKPQQRPVTPASTIATPTAPPECIVSVGWLKDLATRGKIKVTKGSTFLAFPVNSAEFDKWAKAKKYDEATLDGAKMKMLNKRLSHSTLGGSSTYELKTLDSSVYHIKGGFILDPITKVPHTQLVPSTNKINGVKVLVLSSPYSISN